MKKKDFPNNVSQFDPKNGQEPMNESGLIEKITKQHSPIHCPQRKMSCFGKISIGLGGAVIVALLTCFIFGKSILNGFIKGKVERGYEKRHLGMKLQLGDMDYSLTANCLSIQSASLASANRIVEFGSISLTGVKWLRLVIGSMSLTEACANASIDIQDLDFKFLMKQYGMRCKKLRASVEQSELMADGIEILPLAEDEKLFASNPFRMTRFKYHIPNCRVLGVSFSDLLEKKSFQASLVEVINPVIHVLANLRKPNKPFVKSPRMAAEALAALRWPLQIKKLHARNCQLTYGEQVINKDIPGVLAISEADLEIKGIDSRGEPSSAVEINARGKLMEKGLFRAQMKIPLDPGDLSLQFSGSLGTMDLTAFNSFLEIVEHTRIKSGQVQKAIFEIDVSAGQARGFFRVNYKDLNIVILDKKTGSKKGIENRFATIFANLFKVRHGSDQDVPGKMKEGRVHYVRKPDNTFPQFVWFSLRSGVLNVIAR
jgi:hypothetical protein